MRSALTKRCRCHCRHRLRCHFKCNDTWQKTKWSGIKTPSTLKRKANDRFEKQTYKWANKWQERKKYVWKNALQLRTSSILAFTVPHRTAMYIVHSGWRKEWNFFVAHRVFLSYLNLMSHLFQTIQFGIESVWHTAHHGDRHLFLFVPCLTFRSDIFVISNAYICIPIVNRNNVYTRLDGEEGEKAHSHKLCQKSKTCFQ